MPLDPEAVWQQSQLDFNTTAGFLHENCLHFLEDAAIEDAALETEAFSDAGLCRPSFSLASPVLERSLRTHPPWCLGKERCPSLGL